MQVMNKMSFRMKLIIGVLVLAGIGAASFKMGLIGSKPMAGGPRIQKRPRKHQRCQNKAVLNPLLWPHQLD